MQCKGWVLICTGIGSQGVDVRDALNSAKLQTENNTRRKVSWLRFVENRQGAAPVLGAHSSAPVFCSEQSQELESKA